MADAGKIIALAKAAVGADVDELKSAIESLGGNTPEMFGAVGDGETDDTDAVQAACDAGYEVRFGSNKTYYLASAVTIDHDCHLVGGENTKIITKTPLGGTVNDGIVVTGTLKKTTSLTTDYSSVGTTANCNNKFTLSDMTDINIGDLMVITAKDQHYHYARPYYYIGTTLMITDTYDGHIYTADYMPWDITNSEYVTVKIYDAPSVVIENLQFESDLDSIGAYRYLLNLQYCKNSTVKNCTFTNMAQGILLDRCSNIEINGVCLAKSKYDNSLSGDGYGIFIQGCTNTVIERVITTCAQHSITVTGQLVSMNTYIKNCNLTSECRAPGLDTHESTYNLVIEDSVLGTAALNATCTLNRCKVFTNRRAGSSGEANISVYGSHNAKRSKVRISNTEFNGASINIARSIGQDPVQSYDNVYGEIIIENCTGGGLNITSETSTMIISNTIESLTIKNWTDCKEIYNAFAGTIKKLVVNDSTFREHYFINDHNSGHGCVDDNVEYLDVSNIKPLSHKISVAKDTMGENIVLPAGVTINLSSNNSSAKYIVCGSNLVSDNIDDYCIGTISGSAGETLTRTPKTGTGNPSISFDSGGDLVYSQGSTTSKLSVYQLCMFYVKEDSVVNISAKLINSGETTGASFRASMAIVDCSTGKLIDRYLGTVTQATAQGATCSNSHNVYQNCIVLCYFYCADAISGSETTFDDLSIECTPYYAPAIVDQPYIANRRTGDGTVASIAGVNNIMCSDLDFHVELKADFVNNPIGLLPNATGVSF